MTQNFCNDPLQYPRYSGMPMAQTIPTHELAIICNGSVPCLMSAMRYDAPIIGISTNESSCWWLSCTLCL